MSFIAAAIGVAGAIGGAAISSRGASRAASTAAEGSREEIAFNRESRDLARADQAPYREAGATALDALMSMTGLAKPRSAITPSFIGPRQIGSNNPYLTGRTVRPGIRGSSYRSLYSGGEMDSGKMYNVHELGPENVYSEGAYTRGKGPATIDGKTGYVEPNIESRYDGGIIGGAYDDRFIAPPPGPYQPPTTPPAIQSPAAQPRSGTALRYPNENPGGVEGGYNFMTDPGYQFRFGEGIDGLDRSASARGGLLSGGMVKKAIRYGQGIASDEYTNVYNRISNIAGLGQVSATTSGNAALHAGASMGNSASNAANATAYGQVGSSNAWANAANQVAQLPWGSIFNRDKVA